MYKIVDKSGNEWEKDQVQALICHVAALSKAAKRLGVNVSFLRREGLLSPVEYARKRSKEDPQWLKDLIIRCDGKKEAAKELGVSVSTICGFLQEIGCNFKARVLEHCIVKELMERFGSCLLVARILESSVTEVKRALPEWRELKTGEKAGDHSVRTGQIGEKAYKELRGDKVLESPCFANPNHRGWDHRDSEYGRVNVKTSKMYLVKKGKECRWVWSVVLGEREFETDSFAFVQLNGEMKPIGILVVKRDSIGEQVNLVVKRRRNGIYGVMAKEVFRVIN